MKIALIGYGKMGHMIEEIALQRGHEIVCKIDVNNPEDIDSPEFCSAEMHNKGVDAVVARMNLQYKVPLQCDDEFLSRLWLEKQGVRYVFHQDIFRASDEKLCLKATVELVCLINGKLGNSEDYDKAFEKYFSSQG